MVQQHRATRGGAHGGEAIDMFLAVQVRCGGGTLGFVDLQKNTCPGGRVGDPVMSGVPGLFPPS